MQHQAVCLDLRRFFTDFCMKRGVLSSSSSVRTEVAGATAGRSAADLDERADLGGPVAGPAPGAVGVLVRDRVATFGPAAKLTPDDLHVRAGNRRARSSLQLWCKERIRLITCESTCMVDHKLQLSIVASCRACG